MGSLARRDKIVDGDENGRQSMIDSQCGGIDDQPLGEKDSERKYANGRAPPPPLLVEPLPLSRHVSMRNHRIFLSSTAGERFQRGEGGAGRNRGYPGGSYLVDDKQEVGMNSGGQCRTRARMASIIIRTALGALFTWMGMTLLDTCTAKQILPVARMRRDQAELAVGFECHVHRGQRTCGIDRCV